MKKVFLFLLLAISLCGCYKDLAESNPAAKKTLVLPLSVGNKWTFRETEYNENGTVASIDTAIIQVVAQKQINNQTWYLLTSADPTDTIDYFRSDDSTAYTYDATNATSSKVFGLVKTDGEEIGSQTTIFGVAKTTGSTKTVPINSYDSYVNVTSLGYNGLTIKVQEIYFKPGVGITSLVGYEINSNLTGTYKSTEDVLIKYAVK